MISLHAQHSACINYLTHKANGNNFLFLQSRKHKTAQMQTHIPNNLLILSLSQCCSYGKTKRRYFNLYELAKFEWKCNNIMALVCMMTSDLANLYVGMQHPKKYQKVTGLTSSEALSFFSMFCISESTSIKENL